jgi:hypothetical protein
MFSAVDAGLIMDLAKKEKEEIERLKSTEEGRAELAFRTKKKEAFSNIPDGAKCYHLVKLSRHQNPENQNRAPVAVGTGGLGYVRVLTDEMIKALEDDSIDQKNIIQWEAQLEAKPKIGSVFYVGDVGNWLRTSVIRSYYVHDDPEGYAEHPDKLVLPKEFPIQSNAFMPELVAGDIVLCTMNSLYLCRERPGKEYVKDFLGATLIDKKIA